jgi:hypothetical protein
MAANRNSIRETKLEVIAGKVTQITHVKLVCDATWKKKALQQSRKEIHRPRKA